MTLDLKFPFIETDVPRETVMDQEMVDEVIADWVREGRTQARTIKVVRSVRGVFVHWPGVEPKRVGFFAMIRLVFLWSRRGRRVVWVEE